jgi:hypothetical protein
MKNTRSNFWRTVENTLLSMSMAVIKTIENTYMLMSVVIAEYFLSGNVEFLREE